MTEQEQDEWWTAGNVLRVIGRVLRDPNFPEFAAGPVVLSLVEVWEEEGCLVEGSE